MVAVYCNHLNCANALLITPSYRCSSIEYQLHDLRVTMYSNRLHVTAKVITQHRKGGAYCNGKHIAVKV